MLEAKTLHADSHNHNNGFLRRPRVIDRWIGNYGTGVRNIRWPMYLLKGLREISVINGLSLDDSCFSVKIWGQMG